MPVYWSMFIFAVVLILFSRYATKGVIQPNGDIQYSTSRILVVLTAGYIAVFASLRDAVLDTYAYIDTFENMSTEPEMMIRQAVSSSGRGFNLILGLFKIYISENHYLWLGFVACVSLYCLFRFYRKYSCDYAFTFFLFIASTNFTWLLNGARQFLAVCVLIGFVDWWVSGDRKHKLLYALLAIGMTAIHSSVWFVLPMVYMSARGKLLDKWMFIVLVGTVFVTMNTGNVVEFASDVMNKDYTVSMSESRGASYQRFLISLVPLCMVLPKLKKVREAATPIINFSINMSFIGACFFFVAMFSSGILAGRMPIYFTLYNYILIPWLLKKFYPNPILSFACVLFYSIFFYYQMCVAWHNLTYVSDILGIKCLNALGF